MSSPNSLSDNGGVDLASQYALRVALQTMKERCIALQQRLSTVEEENTILRNQTSINLQNPELNILRDCETDNLRKQIEELTQQKLQLTEHISMVATENRQLWSRLSQLAKNDKQKEQKKDTLTTATTTTTENQHSTSSYGQNLIRSRTFTQNSPNPLLRQKHLAALAAGTTTTVDKSLDDLSLEEISLKDVNKKYEDEENDNGGGDDNCRFDTEMNGKTVITSNSLGFGYLNDDSSDGAGDNDLETETKKCIDNMIDIKKEVLKQHDELTAALNALKEKKALVQQECIECKLRNNSKPEMADKIIETRDDLIGESLRTINSVPVPVLINNQVAYSSNRSKIVDGEGGRQEGEGSDNADHVNILEMKKCADRVDKMCPMCGKIFNETVLFNSFQEHVETHFIDDVDLDSSTFDRNFELVSHTVGDF